MSKIYRSIFIVTLLAAQFSAFAVSKPKKTFRKIASVEASKAFEKIPGSYVVTSWSVKGNFGGFPPSHTSTYLGADYMRHPPAELIKVEGWPRVHIYPRNDTPFGSSETSRELNRVWNETHRKEGGIPYVTSFYGFGSGWGSALVDFPAINLPKVQKTLTFDKPLSNTQDYWNTADEFYSHDKHTTFTLKDNGNGTFDFEYKFEFDGKSFKGQMKKVSSEIPEYFTDAR